MPTLLREGPFASSTREIGGSHSELRRVERIIKENQTSFLGEWNARFNN